MAINNLNGDELGSWWRKQWSAVRETIRDFQYRVLHEPAVRLMAGLGVIVFLLAMGVWQYEERRMPADTKHPETYVTTLGKAIYFMFVSGTTAGYGDMTAKTGVGRALAISIILCGMVLTSLLTATIASWFVERRIMEGRGMEKIPWNGHVVLCGWNGRAKDVLAGIYRDSKDEEIVLINNLPEDQINEILYQYKRQGLRFVRGDFVHESVLQRAAVAKARAVVILADDQKEQGYTGADQRTALCALVVKSMNPAIKVTAELVEEDNASHLQRAQVDHIILLGEHVDLLLSSSVTAPGVTLAIQDLLSPRRGPLIQQARIPGNLIEQTFAELAQYFREKRGALLIGIFSREEQGMSLDDILSEDMSAIDLFIKSQFEGLEHDYFSKASALKVRINPPDTYVIQKNDRALLILDPVEARGAQGGQSG
jgi:voltage-gated potassium channel